MSIYFVTVRGKLPSGTLRCLLTTLVQNICSGKLKVKVTLEGQTEAIGYCKYDKLKFLVHKYLKTLAV